jgi:thiamine-monophosphate kinase
MKDSDEFSILKKVFKSLGNQYFDSSNVLLGPGDDAGLFDSKKELIFSTDTSVANIHFPLSLDPKKIAFRSCAVAASDMAACGGSLKWLSISLTASSKNKEWIEKFSKGIRQFSNQYEVPIIGGDLSLGKEISVSIGVCGEIKKKYFMKRSGAKVKDHIFVTGKLGEAFLGLKLLQSKKKNLSFLEKQQLNKYLKPKIEIAFSKDLSKLANSCIDVSDGLLGDLGHICEQSKVGAELFLESIPLQGDYQTALSWGDDYQLCFTADSSKIETLNQLAKLHDVKISKIGFIKKEKGVSVFSNGKELTIKKAGYNHFNE